MSLTAVVTEAVHQQHLRGQSVPVLTAERADDHPDPLKASQSTHVPVVVAVVSGGLGRRSVDVVQAGQHQFQSHAQVSNQRLNLPAAEVAGWRADVHDYPLVLQVVVRVTLPQERQHVDLRVTLGIVPASVATSAAGEGQGQHGVHPGPVR